MTNLITTAETVESEQLRRLKIASILEATTLVLLVCVAVPLKHVFGVPTGSSLLGPIHGVAFLAYVWLVAQTVATGHWRVLEIARLLIVAFIPFAGFLNIRWLQERARKAQVAEQL